MYQFGGSQGQLDCPMNRVANTVKGGGSGLSGKGGQYRVGKESFVKARSCKFRVASEHRQERCVKARGR
jgi:hypothetical protein